MTTFLSWLIEAGLWLLTLNILLCLWRVARGPSPFDRVLGLECITYNVSGMVVLMSLQGQTAVFFDFLLVVALLGFIGTIAIAAHLEGRTHA